ncbi:MAG: tRNA dimethylallyltransferase [Polyangiales bacterium]|jgi:tRNA dimethylallyltransferase
MSTLDTKLLIVAGCTGSGKTSVAVKLAKRFGGEIVGADSVQVYRGFDIGSAKPSEEELEGVPHHLLDIVNPDENIDAMDYARRADAVISDIRARERLPILVGGTGLWIRALVRGLVELPPVDAELRAGLLAEGERDGREALHKRLQTCDPISAGNIHPRDLVRVSRALEVFEQTGKPLGELRAAHALGSDRYDNLFAVIAHETDHDARLDARREQMLSAGWRAETEALLAKWSRSARPFGSVGYAQMVRLIDGELRDEEMRATARKATRVYARRQRTWFGSEPGVDWRPTRGALVSDSGLARIEAWL